MGADPYDWQRPRPAVWVPPTAFEEMVAALRSGQGIVLVGGRGLGKSSVLGRLLETVRNVEAGGIQAFEVSPPAARRTMDAVIRTLSDTLNVPFQDRYLDDLRPLLAAARNRHGCETISLFIDEIESWGSRPGQDVQLGRDFLNLLEPIRQRGGLSVAVAGGLGTYQLRGVLGSSFVARAKEFLLEPWNRQDLMTAASLFVERGSPVSETALEAIRVLSGGHPALATFLLQSLYRARVSSADTSAETDTEVVTRAVAEFEERHARFRQEYLASIREGAFGQVAWSAFERIRTSPGALSQNTLMELCRGHGTTESVDPRDAIRMLRAAGLIRIDGSWTADPLGAWPISSILPPPVGARADVEPDFTRQLFADVSTVCERMRVTGPDFFKGEQLVEEKVLSATLKVALEAAGWQVEREAQRGAGRTDLLLRHSRFPRSEGVIEVKRRSNNDCHRIHAQLLSYTTSTTTAALGVVFGTAPRGCTAETPADFLRDCLPSADVTLAARTPDVAAVFDGVAQIADGTQFPVRYVLAQLPRP